MKPYHPATYVSVLALLGILLLAPKLGYAQNEIPVRFNYNVTSGLSLGAIEPASQDTVPLPRKVMMRSVILPGWGQYTNKQAWKIPIVYGLIGGLSYYAYFANTRFTGYRAAYYNSFDGNDDFKFGQTPGWIDPNVSQDFLRTSRDFYRNRRDFLIVTVFLAYVLNFVDAYVYAQMRDFDVSDDLSSRIEIGPSVPIAEKPTLGFTFKLRF